MLFSAVSGPLANGSSRPLYGGAIGYSYGLGDSAGVSQLQQALISYAQNTQDPGANPGPADGNMNDWTALATIYVVWKAADKVPGLKQIKSDLIGNVPGVSTLVNTLLGNVTAMLVAWGIAKTASPSTIAGITSFISNHAAQLAAGVNVAAGLSLGPPPPIPPVAQTTINNQGIKYMNVNTALITKNMAATLPKGSIQTFDKKLIKYRIAVPKGLSGFLGEVTHVERVDLATTTPRADATIVSNDDFAAKAGATDLEPWYKTTLGMVGIGVGVVALGVGGYYLVK